MSTSNSLSVPYHNDEYYARSPGVRYKNTGKRKSSPIKYETFKEYYNNTNPGKNFKEYQERFKVSPPSSPFGFGFDFESSSPSPKKSPRISKRRREENEKLEAVRKRNENRRRKENEKLEAVRKRNENRRRKENEKLEAVRKRNENRRRKEAVVKKAKEEAVKKSKSLGQQLKNAKTLSNLKKVYRKGALIKHPNKGGTKSNFQKWKNLFNTRKNSINLK